MNYNIDLKLRVLFDTIPKKQNPNPYIPIGTDIKYINISKGVSIPITKFKLYEKNLREVFLINPPNNSIDFKIWILFNDGGEIPEKFKKNSISQTTQYVMEKYLKEKIEVERYILGSNPLSNDLLNSDRLNNDHLRYTYRNEMPIRYIGGI